MFLHCRSATRKTGVFGRDGRRAPVAAPARSASVLSDFEQHAAHHIRAWARAESTPGDFDRLGLHYPESGTYEADAPPVAEA
jgi:hypothetical protein